jgi:hypothetical protein
MGTATGPSTRTSVPLLVRLAVLGITVAAAVISFATYEPQDVGPLRPQPNIIANTWYGPILALLVPIALSWVALGIKRKWVKLLALSLTLLLLLGCLDWIYVIRDMSGTLPDALRRTRVM